MNLGKKKVLAAKTLGVGKKRIVFLQPRLSEIKEAITKQDIRDLQKDGALVIKEIKGRRKSEKRGKKNIGSVRKKVNKRKQEYVIMTRKLRKYSADKKNQGLLNREELIEIRKKIRNKAFRSKAHLRDYIKELRE